MRQDDFPHPVSDPAASGLPEYADDDSAANLDAPSTREADGPDPAPLPPDREDGPLALDEYGTTAEEQRHGEPLDDRLAREEPDVAAATPDGAPRGRPDDLVDADVPHEWNQPDPAATSGSEPDSTGGTVGRLVQPDEGTHADTEPDEVARDAGAAGGGASAEEAAMHEVRD
jgi:hypothetical protein